MLYHNLEGIEFHPKVIIAKSNGAMKRAIVGSSNVTSGGQENNVEANVSVEIENSNDLEARRFETDITNSSTI